MLVDSLRADSFGYTGAKGSNCSFPFRVYRVHLMRSNLTPTAANAIAALLTIFAFCAVGPCFSAAQTPFETDEQAIYHLVPVDSGVQLEPAQPEQVRAGYAYSYYNERLARRVWGFAREDGSFEYAFGEGTMLPADRFDLGLSLPSDSSLLDGSSSALRQGLAATGGPPTAMMTNNGQWKLLTFRVSVRIFDIETNHRWEWHGNRRVDVVHTYGDLWQVVDGRYVPLGGVFLNPPIPVCSPLQRVGSAMYLVHTPPHSR